MIFRQQQRAMIFNGIKTEARRPVHADQSSNHYRRHKLIAVQAEVGKTAITQIRLLEVRRELLGLIDADGVGAEGHEDLAGFARLWLSLHDPDARMRRAASRDPDAVNGLTDGSVLDHWQGGHADRLVWVLSFERVLQAPPLLLAAAGGVSTGGTHPLKSNRGLGDAARRNAAERDRVRDLEGIGPRRVSDEAAAALDAKGYTASTARALPDEPESVGDVSRLPASVKAVRRYETLKLREAAELRTLPLTVRMLRARQLARDRHDNVTLSDLRVVHRLVWSDHEEAAARRLDAIEGRLLSPEAREAFPERAAQEDTDRKEAA